MILRFFALTSSLLLVAPVAVADMDSSTCLAQMQNILGTGLNCALKLTPGPEEAAKLKVDSSGALTGYECTIVINAPKADIYGKWIVPNAVRLPALPVACVVSTTGDAKATISAIFQPECVRAAATQPWECKPGAQRIEGLGVLGTILQNFINHDNGLKQGMRQALERLEQRPAQL